MHCRRWSGCRRRPAAHTFQNGRNAGTIGTALVIIAKASRAGFCRWPRKSPLRRPPRKASPDDALPPRPAMVGSDIAPTNCVAAVKPAAVCR